MDNLYSVFIAAVSAGALLVACYVVAKSAERVLLARWDVAKAEGDRTVMVVELEATGRQLKQLEKELDRTKSELEKLRSMPVPRARF